MRNSGRYICISLLQEHILKTILENFSSDYALRVIRCHEAELKAREKDESPMPVFVIVATKFIKLPQSVSISDRQFINMAWAGTKFFKFQIVEIVLTDGPPIRLSNFEELISSVTSTQESATLCNNLYKSSVSNEGEVSLDLYQPGDKEPRYTVYILDQLMAKERKTYACFIVPQGR